MIMPHPQGTKPRRKLTRREQGQTLSSVQAVQRSVANRLKVPVCGGLIPFGEHWEKQAGGEGGIRTPDTVARTPHFECGAFNHSATSPEGPRLLNLGARVF